MPGPLARSAVFLAVPVTAVVAVAGALALRVPGLVTLLVTAALVGATAAGMAREAPERSRGSAVDAGVRAAGWTAGVLLVLAGLVALVGGLVAVLVAATVAAVVTGARLRRAARRSGPPLGAPSRPSPVAAARPPAPTRTPSGSTTVLPPVGGLTARSLGEEWLRTTALLETRLDPAVRRAVVARRESLLDELERRDPVGFGRWLTDGATPGSNPADHVRDLPAAGTGAA